MNILSELQSRFAVALSPLVDDVEKLLDMIRPAQDSRFGDYQANCAMPLGKTLGKPPRDVAEMILEKLSVDDICETPEIAGPGFINLRLKDTWLSARLAEAVNDDRLGVEQTKQPKTIVVDYSSPNVAKPMHVGHIRTTVIGDALVRTLRFLGHTVVSDNHLGDWGTQFGMIIYGYKHFVDRDAYAQRPVAELGRLYRLVRQIMDYHDAVKKVPELQQRMEALGAEIAELDASTAPSEKSEKKKLAKQRKRLVANQKDTQEAVESLKQKIAAVESEAVLKQLVHAHPDVGSAVLAETAKLHAGDEANLQLWTEFLPECRKDIQRIYDRLNVSFDEELGESYYHDRLGAVVESFQEKGLATESDGAICVFLEGFEAPMIIQKQDGAFLYATTDLATIQYRMERWSPDAILYVVDFRQGEHFDKLFAASRLIGYTDVELRHVKFGTVLGDDGKPFKTRDGDTVGLEVLLDAAVERAYQVICENDDGKLRGAELSETQRRETADIIGHAAIKYADLSQNRASDYVYSEDKMVALKGNTATYMQYSFARTKAIFKKGEVDVDALRKSNSKILLEHEKERALGLQLLRFSEALDDVLVDYEPNQLTAYLFELAGAFSQFYEVCKVLGLDSESTANSRLLLCDLVGRTIQLGLSLLGIKTVEKM